MGLELKIGQCSLGNGSHAENEDVVHVQRWDNATVCQIADGDTGWAEELCGRLASERAIEVIYRGLRQRFTSCTSILQAQEFLRTAIVQANRELVELASHRPNGWGGATTLVVLVWPGGKQIYISSLGDSRAYIIRDQQIEQLTVDDTLAQALYAAGNIPEEAIRTHKFRHFLCKFLGTPAMKEGPEVRIVPIQSGDRFLLSTDGLHEALADEALLRAVLDLPDPNQCAKALCQMAVANGSRDDVSCIVIQVQGQ